MQNRKRGHQTALWTKSFTMLVIASLFLFMSFQMLIPTLPPYIKSLGASGFEIGMITLVFSVGAILTRPLIGYMLEFRPRKPLVLIGAGGLLAVTILYPLTQIVTILLLFRLLHGLMWGWSSTVNGTAAVDLVPNERLGEGMGYYGLSITVGMIIAPSLGIYVYQNFPFTVLIVISALLGFIAFILLAFIQYHTPDNILTANRKNLQFSIADSLVEKSSLTPAVITFLATFGYGTIVTFIVIFAEERGIAEIFLFYLLNALTATLIRPITGRWFDRKGPIQLVAFCSLLTFISMWMLSFSSNWLGIVVAGPLFGAGYGSLIPAMQAWVLAMTPHQRRGVANGMFYSAIDLGIGLSGLVFGLIALFVGTAQLFQISSFFFLIVVFITLSVGKKWQKESETRKKREFLL